MTSATESALTDSTTVSINPEDEASWTTVSGRPVPDVSASSGCCEVLVFDCIRGGGGESPPTGLGLRTGDRDGLRFLSRFPGDLVFHLLGLFDRVLSLVSLSFLSCSTFFKEASFSCSICLCRISSFFCSRKAEGMPAMFSCALSSRGQRSLMNSRAFFPFRNPVRLICIILLSGCCNTNTKGERETNMAV